ncbi:hypothetical protein HY009_06940 [Candidatus Acetothermia bacterium]|nr:hypothetical protein [Candidatus Acetothermia bacterium]
MAKIEELLKKYPGEWLAIEVTDEVEGVPVAGELICHSSHRAEVWRKTQAKKRVYVTYAGPPLKEGYAAAF